MKENELFNSFFCFWDLVNCSLCEFQSATRRNSDRKSRSVLPANSACVLGRERAAFSPLAFPGAADRSGDQPRNRRVSRFSAGLYTRAGARRKQARIVFRSLERSVSIVRDFELVFIYYNGFWFELKSCCNKCYIARVCAMARRWPVLAFGAGIYAALQCSIDAFVRTCSRRGTRADYEIFAGFTCSNDAHRYKLKVYY